MSKRKRYLVRAEITISLHQHVWAESEDEAKERAEELGLPSIHNPGDWHYKAAKREEDEADEWRTSGELDGEPKVIEAEVDEP